MQLKDRTINRSEIKNILGRGSEKIAPLWSLENFVAVNPYLGLADMEFEAAMDFLYKSGRVRATLPESYFLEALQQGRLTKEDIKKALEENTLGIDHDVAQFLEAIRSKNILHGEGPYIRSLSDVAAEINSKKWDRFMVDRISFWASAYFDKHQAIWDTAEEDITLFAAWKREAEVDYSPEAMGLKGFRKFIKKMPDDYLEAAALAWQALEIPADLQDLYLNNLLMKMNGWIGFAARMDWDARLAGQQSNVVEEFLAVLLVWEMSLKKLLDYPSLEQAWLQARSQAELMVINEEYDQKLAYQMILQNAFDKANQRAIMEKINQQQPKPSKDKTVKAQAIFCIDVRSELYRRNLEAADDHIETMGFAGFFAFPIKYVPLAHNEGSNQCPVLLTTSHTIKEGLYDPAEEQRAASKRRLGEQVSKAWKSFKLGAITCFSFVGPVGLSYLPKLFTDSFGFTRPVAHPDQAGLTEQQLRQKGVRLDRDDVAGEVAGIPAEDRLTMAASALKAMSLTENFARTVLIVGHGSTTVNNPHATGLDCGACGGHTGEANAKVAVAVLNDPEVRKGLKESGIAIPEHTLFVAALHDTTTDEVKLFELAEGWPDTHKQDIKDLKESLKTAGETARRERAIRMNINEGEVGKQVIQRSKDWSQVRPEWGLAGCSSFIVAPRYRTAQLNFEGKAFMHSYSWRKDTDFSILELIMTAPMVVTSWINLQYYASTVDNKKFGSGNKTLHNVVGGLGVLEGFAGDLRVGLPWQSVHDGEQFQHEPQRLNVIIEAPVDEMSKILAKHDSIRQLCDNKWIYLFAMDDEGKIAHQYIGNLEWKLL